jgi:hypothetical protein
VTPALRHWELIRISVPGSQCRIAIRIRGIGRDRAAAVKTSKKVTPEIQRLSGLILSAANSNLELDRAPPNNSNVRTLPLVRTSTAAEDYAWVNTRQFSGSGTVNFATGKIRIDAYTQ